MAQLKRIQDTSLRAKITYSRTVIVLSLLTILCILLTFNDKAIKSICIIIGIIILGVLVYLYDKLRARPFDAILLRIINKGPKLTPSEEWAILIGILICLGIIYFTLRSATGKTLF